MSRRQFGEIYWAAMNSKLYRQGQSVKYQVLHTIFTIGVLTIVILVGKVLRNTVHLKTKNKIPKQFRGFPHSLEYTVVITRWLTQTNQSLVGLRWLIDLFIDLAQ